MSNNNRTLKINPDLFKINGKLGKEKKNKSLTLKNKPIIDEENSSKANKIKKEMMKKVKDFQRNKEKEKLDDEKKEKKQHPDNLFEKNTYENSDFEREFNKSLNFLQDLAKKNKEKKKKNKTVKNSIPNVEISLNLPDNLDIPNKIEEKNINSSLNTSYGCLKNGKKPTFKQLNKTQKNNDDFKQKVKIVLENNVYDDDIKPDIKPRIEPVINPIIESLEETKPNLVEEINNKIENLNDILPMKKIKNELLENEKKNEIIELSTKPFMDNNEIDKVIKNEEEAIKLNNIPKIKRITRKSTYKLGKLKNKNAVGILIKNRETQKNIKHEVSLLKQKSIQDIKNHLRSKNLIKVGCDAPNDVLRKMYEDSILLGELENNNNSNALYNYLNE
jgi:hypothetical protein